MDRRTMKGNMRRGSISVYKKKGKGPERSGVILQVPRMRRRKGKETEKEWNWERKRKVWTEREYRCGMSPYPSYGVRSVAADGGDV